ncbi:UNVERIFIED_CONTAM: hypothetical protein HDU68_006424 [Siphonaria sp. JEL0065]|nr:hypothetical protein HDU68_006424 [Siphonaria sp. JEL0065]
MQITSLFTSAFLAGFAIAAPVTHTGPSVVLAARDSIPDWYTCGPTDTCASASSGFVCCVAPGDGTKTTCRPSNNCESTTPTTVTVTAIPGVGDWNTCHPGIDQCANADAKCCIAAADLITQKYTCRPYGQDCVTVTTTASPTPTLSPLPNGSFCGLNDQCASVGYKCCRKPNDLTGDHVCRKAEECDNSPMWAGVNSYFLGYLPEKDQRYLLGALQDAGVTKVRVFVTEFALNANATKGTNATATPDLEMKTLGVYNDSTLKGIDRLLSLVPQYEIKLIIALHDRWNLDNKWGSCDAYCQAFCKHDGKKCTSAKGAASFYTDPKAKQYFDMRAAHIVNHANQYMQSRPWAQLSESIYAFEIQNEGQSELNLPNPDWWCERATRLKNQLSNNGILIATGGTQYPSDSLIDNNFKCPALDIIAVHAFSTGDAVPVMKTALEKAQKYKKLVVLEEFGAQGKYQAPTIAYTAELANFNRIPWMPWEVSTVSIPGDFEFSPEDKDTWAVLTRYAKAAV